jgi:hypothetical protein
LRVSLADVCDFESQGLNRRQVGQAIRELLGSAEPEKLRTALKALKAILR